MFFLKLDPFLEERKLVSPQTTQLGSVARLAEIENRANDLFNAMMRIANKLFDDDELGDACRRVEINDIQLWLKPPPMPRTTNLSRVLGTARRAGGAARRGLAAQILVLDQPTVALVIDGLGTVVQDLQDADATGLSFQFLVSFYELVVGGYESSLAPLLRQAEEQGL